VNNAAISGMEKERAGSNEKGIMRMADYTELAWTERNTLAWVTDYLAL